MPLGLNFDGDDVPGQTRALIGVVLAVTGNIFISLALNLQKYAHNRIQNGKDRSLLSSTHSDLDVNFDDPPLSPLPRSLSPPTTSDSPARLVPVQTRPRTHPNISSRHSLGNDDGDSANVLSPLLPKTNRFSMQSATPLPNSSSTGPSNSLASPRPSIGATFNSERNHTALDAKPTQEPNTQGTAYLRSRWWWLGMVLMVSGEIGNFMAYGFAPASVVAPLGTVTLITNVFLAPLILKERVRGRDLLGVILAATGAVVVVSSLQSVEVVLTPGALWEALLSFQSILYYLVTVAAILGLVALSPQWGNRIILVNLGLTALYGGYTVLSTKALSSLLQLKFILVFKYPITYFLLAILLYSAVLQIRYLNRALQYFDSTQVIPTQFVLFTLSAIVGSAVIYRDFSGVSLEDALWFILGCSLTFSGVFFITSQRNVNKGHLSRRPSMALEYVDHAADEAWAETSLPGRAGDSVGIPSVPSATLANASPTEWTSPIVVDSVTDNLEPLWAYIHKNTATVPRASQDDDTPRLPAAEEVPPRSTEASRLSQAFRVRCTDVANRLRSNSRSLVDHAAQFHGVLNPAGMVISSTQENEAELFQQTSMRGSPLISSQRALGSRPHSSAVHPIADCGPVQVEPVVDGERHQQLHHPLGYSVLSTPMPSHHGLNQFKDLSQRSWSLLDPLSGRMRGEQSQNLLPPPGEDPVWGTSVNDDNPSITGFQDRRVSLITLAPFATSAEQPADANGESSSNAQSSPVL
ncbi:hypothetical protein IWQ62_001522 [Dispira parvispora]|uniref:Uncharacterized protein n=1 Tax=Dispira parvispora TaxID=1520584 RepID=A0A9W8AXT1_9FUNG|nr:hypothetical protein IWQ62_001522 [Dispira parvispora]